MIDLHMHSNCSDGTLTPEALVDEAVRRGVTILALTDHDTIDGVPAFLRAAQRAGITAISGVELSTSFAPGELHMLGYFVNHMDAVFRRQLEWVRSARHARNEEIFHKLHKLGLHLTWSEVNGCAGPNDLVGRPHIAQAMMKRGYVQSTKEAFKRYLSRGCPAYAPRRAVEPIDAIEMIREAGGLPVLAHPYSLALNREDIRHMLFALRDAGLEGLEVYYSSHNDARQERYLEYATEVGLIPTGGSDYHGAHTPDIQLGNGFGNLRVPDDTLDKLIARRKELGYG